jgi:hypothetical protein
MTSNSAQTIVEPTADQLLLITSLERRARSAFDELDEVERAITELREQGNPGASGMSLDLDADDIRDYLENLHGLAVTGGRLGFDDWWSQRVDGGSTLGNIVDGSSRVDRAMILAIEAAVEAEDKELVDALDKTAGDHYIHDEEEYARRAGMTRAEVTARAGAAITKLIESGWRP